MDFVRTGNHPLNSNFSLTNKFMAGRYILYNKNGIPNKTFISFFPLGSASDRKKSRFAFLRSKGAGAPIGFFGPVFDRAQDLASRAARLVPALPPSTSRKPIWFDMRLNKHIDESPPGKFAWHNSSSISSSPPDYFIVPLCRVDCKADTAVMLLCGSK